MATYIKSILANNKRLISLYQTNVLVFKLSTASGTHTIHENAQENDTSKTEPLYPGHIPISFPQQILLTLGSAGMSLFDPYRDDMIATFGETTGQYALEYIHQRMMSNPEGQQILRDQPRIHSSTLDLKYLASLPDNSLGRRYLRFLEFNKVTPDTRAPVQYVPDPTLAYVMARYRETHDLVHTLLDMPTNMIGEVAVKWVEALQTKLPMCIAAAIFGPLRFSAKQRALYLRTYLPWAIDCGTNAKFLMNVYFEQRWDQPFEDLLLEMNISALKRTKAK